MSFRGLEYAISEAIIAIKRNILMSIASIMTSALTLTILAGVTLISLGLHNGATNFLEQSEVAVFTYKNSSRTTVDKIKAEIDKINNVKSIEYISAAKAWDDLKAKLKDDVELGGIQSNPLPDSFRIKLIDQKYADETAQKIEALKGVEEVIMSKEYIDQILKLINVIKIIGIIATALFFIFTAFIISNTIRLTVYARRKEIKIMQMVGASNWFIRMPLLIEGSILGLIGSGIACLLTYASSYYIGTWATNIVPLLGNLSSGIDQPTVFKGIILLGWLIGLMGTMISIQRYLKYEKL